MHLLFVFVDGIGIGPEGNDNPFSRLRLPGIEKLGGGQLPVGDWSRVETKTSLGIVLDACLGVDGLPQSGTGQSTLLTGVNCADLAGRHYGPFPHSSALETIENANLFKRLNGTPPTRSAAFVNAYPDRFFDYVERTNRWTVTTLCCLKSGVPLMRMSDLAQGTALAADITGEGLQKLGLETPMISEDKAAERFVQISEGSQLTLFEYFLTDKAGHSQDFNRARSVLTSLDRFLDGVVRRLDPLRHTLIVTSDHGNLEDLSTKSHTRNPVPFLALGPAAPAFRQMKSIEDVTPAIERVASRRGATGRVV